MPGSGRARRTAIWAAGVALIAFAVYRDSKVNISFDSLWTVHEAWSLVREGDLDLDEYRGLIPDDDYRVEEIGGRLRSTFPVGTPLLVAPLVVVVDAGARALGNDPYARLKTVPPDHATTKLAKTLASALVALAAGLLVPLGRLRGLSLGAAAGLALAFAFATPAWSLMSRGLWQHGPVVLCLTAVLLLLALADDHAWATAASALPLAFAVLVRPTAAIPFVAFGVAVAVRWPRRLAAWLAAAAGVLVPFVLWSRSVYGSWLPAYYRPGRLSFHDAYLEALAANLVSPARGLLVYAPLVAFAAWGVWVGRHRLGRREGALDTAAVAACVAHWLGVSGFAHWWAGHGYGPRFMTDLLPLLLWLAMPVLAAVAPVAGSAGRSRLGRWVAAGLLGIAVGWGLWVNLRGARDWGPWRWHETPVDLDAAPSRVWDWHDPPFLRSE